MAMYAAMQGDTPEETRKQNTATILLGTFLEYFDLYLYIHLGIILQRYFFGPSETFTDSLWGAFAGWMLAFAVRPMGAFLFGWWGDRCGRKNVFIMTTILMGLSSIFMGMLPGYDEVGSSSIVMFVALRLVQSMSSAGELPGATVYLSEINKDHPHEAYYLGLIPVAIDAGAVLALTSITGCLMSGYDWAWRVPFFIGGLLAVFGSFARTSLKESKEYIKRQKDIKTSFSLDYFKACVSELKHRKSLVCLVMLMFPLDTYFIYVIGGKHLEATYQLSSFHIVLYNLILAIVTFSITLFIAHLTKHVDPVKLTRVRAFMGLLIYPVIFYFYGIENSPVTFILVQSCFILFIASDTAIYFLYPKVLPIGVRFISYGTIWAFARILTNLIGAAAHTYLYSTYGYWGNFILLYLGALVFLWLPPYLARYADEQTRNTPRYAPEYGKEEGILRTGKWE